MKFPFAPLPGERMLRPVVEVTFPGLALPIPALVDSGALGTRVHWEIAQELDLDLSAGQEGSLSIGGREYFTTSIRTPLTVRKDTRPCLVDFVHDFRSDYPVLLGLRGFFDNYVVRIDAATRHTYLRGRRHPGKTEVW